MRARALLIAALAASVLSVPVTSASATTGISVNGLTDARGRLVPNARQHAELIHRAGIRAARADAFWQWAEPWAPLLGLRSYEWRDFDRLTGLLAVHDIRWMPVIAYSTFWASSVRDTYHAPPADDADYVSYATAFARRYGRGGAFWAERPELNPLPVTAYEVWNEPNLAHFWLPKPDPARYARLFLGTREALKGVDPEATVVMAGMHAHAFDYVQSMYAAEPALRGAVDVFAYHPYGPTVEHVLKAVRRMRSTLDGLGEGHVPMWITELGWATQGSGAVPRAPDPTRAGNLSLSTDVLLRANCAVEMVTPYTWITPERDSDRDNQALGIYRADGTPTETGRAFVESVERDARSGGGTRRLPLCEGQGRGGGAKPLKLGLGLRSGGRGCAEAVVTYRGRPLNGVVVTFTAAGRTARVKTNINGVARRCPGRAAAGRKLTASARLLDVAAAPRVGLRLP